MSSNCLLVSVSVCDDVPVSMSGWTGERCGVRTGCVVIACGGSCVSLDICSMLQGGVYVVL